MIRTHPTQPVMRPFEGNLDLNELVDDFWYSSSRLPGDGSIRVPAGYVTDGASIPVGLWWLVGPPFKPRYQRATVLHDWLYEHKLGSQKVADGLFLELLTMNGVGRIRRTLMWAALRAVGWLYWK